MEGSASSTAMVESMLVSEFTAAATKAVAASTAAPTDAKSRTAYRTCRLGTGGTSNSTTNGIGRDRCLLLNTPPSESGFFLNQLDTTCPDCMVPLDGVTDEGGLQILN